MKTDHHEVQATLPQPRLGGTAGQRASAERGIASMSKVKVASQESS